MGYTCGRRHTEESLREIAKQFKTRAEFQKKDHSAYSIARQKGKVFLDSICEHMYLVSYSTPQLICKRIMEKLLGLKCLYDTRKIITPYELDIYFPEFRLAIEYNGKGWHRSIDAIRRDNNKQKLCDKNNITLIIVKENNRDYENDVKSQLIDNLEIINKITNNNFTESDILNVECLEIYDDIVNKRDIGEIKNKISQCSTIKEFQEKHGTEYSFLRKNKKLELLQHLKQRVQLSDDELFELCKKISNYSDLLKNHYAIYQSLHKRGLLETATEHMDKKRCPYRNHTNDEILELANKFKMKSHLKNKNKSLYSELIKRNIMDLVTYDPNFVYRPHNKIMKELALKKCFEDAKKYDNYEDFKKDKELYKKCTDYKIIRKIIELFPKRDIRDVIMEESKKYKSFKDFTKTIWYRKTKKLPNLIGKIKIQNNWSKTTKDKNDYVEMFPEIVKMINDNVSLKEIEEIAKTNKTTIWRIKKQMHENGILKVEFNHKNAK